MSKKSGSSYIPIDSSIDRMDPMVKVTAVFCLGLSAIIFPHFGLAYIIVALLFVVAKMARILDRFTKFTLSFAIPVLVMLFFIQGFFSPKNETIIADFGFAQLGLEGIYYALKIVGSLLVFLGSFYIMTTTTYPGKLVSAMHRSIQNKKIGYLILATLNVVPSMQRKTAIIQETQNARGLETTGSMKARFNAFIPLIGPVIMSSLVDAQERGMTLETRGFGIEGVQQTSYIEITETKTDKTIKLLLKLFLLAVIIVTIAIKFNLFK